LLLFGLNPVAGRLSDRIGRAHLVLTAAVGLAVLVYPLFRLLTARPELATLVAVQCGLAALLALFTGPAAALIGELFPPRVRSTGISIGYNLAVPIFGGFAPYFVTRLDTGDHLAPAYYMMACAVPTLIALIWGGLGSGMMRNSATMKP
jgi:MHS family proline/betaine transporter-like MFS transporter